MKNPLLLVPAAALLISPASGVITSFTAESDSIIIATPGQDLTGNFGGRNELIAGDTAGQGRHMIMRWDVSSLLGIVDTVNSITVELDLVAGVRAAPTTAQTATVQLISETDKGWVEGTGVNNVTKTGVTWNHANATAENVGTAWSGGAGLAGSTTVADVGTLSIAGTESQGDTISVTISGTDLTALIAGWADDGTSSSGLLFRDDIANSSQQVFFVSKESDPARKGTGTAPRLIVDYTPVPEPSVALLGGLGLLGLLRRRRA
ncbi:MAG: PEP-CTERM sorting domain-containing protein [Verrucomicrobiota bacterium]